MSYFVLDFVIIDMHLLFYILFCFSLDQFRCLFRLCFFIHDSQSILLWTDIIIEFVFSIAPWKKQFTDTATSEDSITYPNMPNQNNFKCIKIPMLKILNPTTSMIRFV